MTSTAIPDSPKKDMTLKVDVKLSGSVNSPKAEFTLLESLPDAPPESLKLTGTLT